MTSTSDEPGYYDTLRYITPDGTAISVDPPFGPFLKLGQHDRIINSTLLDPRHIDIKQIHTVEGIFNKLISEAETTGLVLDLLLHVQGDFDARLKTVAAAMCKSYTEINESMKAFEGMVARGLKQSATFEKRLATLKGQLENIYKYGLTTDTPTPSETTNTPLYKRKRAPDAPQLSKEEKQLRVRTCGTSYGIDRSVERDFKCLQEETRTDILLERLKQGHSRVQASRRKASHDKQSGTALRATERKFAARIVQRQDVARRIVWSRNIIKDKLREDVEVLEEQDRSFSQHWDSNMEKRINGLCETVGRISKLTPHLERCEMMAREVESKLHPVDNEKLIPLLELSFDKPVDEMSEAEMRELLKSLPVAICLDSDLLEGRHDLDSGGGASDEETDYEDEDVKDAVVKDKGKARETLADSTPPTPLTKPHAGTGEIRFGETSFIGKANPTLPAPSTPGVPSKAGRAGKGGGKAPSDRRASAGAPSSGGPPHQTRGVSGSTKAVQSSNKRARSLDEPRTAGDADEQEPHRDDGEKRRKLR